MTTARQIEANQRTPLAPQVRAPSREKSAAVRTRSGTAFPARGFVLPAEEAELVAERIESWSVVFGPRDEQEAWLVEQAALESVRVERCQERERVVLREQSERASFRGRPTAGTPPKCS